MMRLYPSFRESGWTGFLLPYFPVKVLREMNIHSHALKESYIYIEERVWIAGPAVGSASITIYIVYICIQNESVI